MCAVSDAVSKGDDGGTGAFGLDVDTFEEQPGVEVFGAGEGGGGDGVAGDTVVGLVGCTVIADLGDGLIGEKDAHGEIREGSDFEWSSVADDEGSGRNDDGGAVAKGERGCGGDGAAFAAKSDGGCVDGEGLDAELVGEDNANGWAADRDVNDLAEGDAGGVVLVEFAAGVLFSVGRGCPGSYPMVLRLSMRLSMAEGKEESQGEDRQEVLSAKHAHHVHRGAPSAGWRTGQFYVAEYDIVESRGMLWE